MDNIWGYYIHQYWKLLCSGKHCSKVKTPFNTNTCMWCLRNPSMSMSLRIHLPNHCFSQVWKGEELVLLSQVMCKMLKMEVWIITFFNLLGPLWQNLTIPCRDLWFHDTGWSWSLSSNRVLKISYCHWTQSALWIRCCMSTDLARRTMVTARVGNLLLIFQSVS